MLTYTTTHTNITTYNFAVVSCSDGVENGDETDTDCGGSCSACSSSGSSDGGGGSGGGGGAGGAMATSDATSTETETTEDESGSSSDIDSTSEETIEATDEEPVLPDHIAESSKKIIFSKGINNIDFEQEGLAITEIELDLNVDKGIILFIVSLI